MSRRASTLEKQFSIRWLAIVNAPKLVEEYRFDNVRRWRFDFAATEKRVGIEIEGGIWSGGRHTRGTGYSADCEKYNEAAFQGWTVFRLTRSQVEDWALLKRIAEFILAR